MTSIASGTSFAARLSPGERMKQQLSGAVSAGTVKAADQTALASALDDIDTAMKAVSSSSSTGRSAGGKEKIDSLIAQEVKDGKLTDDQATELKKLFADAAPRVGQADGKGGPPPPPPTDGTETSDTTSSLIDSLTAASSTSSTSSASSTDAADPVSALIAFLKTLQSANADKTVYGSTGSSTDSSLQSLLVDTQA